jgi:hypothetical protein
MSGAQRSIEIGSELPKLSSTEFTTYNRLAELMNEVVSLKLVLLIKLTHIFVSSTAVSGICGIDYTE